MWFADHLYAVKFRFRSAFANYAVDLYLIHGNMLSDVRPFVFTRRNGKLVPEKYLEAIRTGTN
jgi:hypothetical protein